MATIHHNIEQRTRQNPDLFKRGYAFLRKISLIGEKETAQMPATPTPFNPEEAEIALAPFKQTVKTPKAIVE